MVYGLGFRNVFLYAFLGTVKTDLTTAGTHIAIVGIGHLARSVDNTAHDAYLQTHKVFRGCLDLCYRLLQVIEGSSATRTRDILGLGEFDAGCLEDGIGQGSEE